MIITILSEPRTGSNNLTNWFYFKKEFTTLFEPLNPLSEWFQLSDNPKEYKCITPHLCLKEVYYPGKNWDNIINNSDKIIVLYRENYQEQLESFLNSVTTNNWDKEYVFKVKETNFVKEKSEYFRQLKIEFKERYLDKNYFKISYEDLYYNNNFQKIVDYIDLDCVKNKNFPYGKKYRLNDNKTKNII